MTKICVENKFDARLPTTYFRIIVGFRMSVIKILTQNNCKFRNSYYLNKVQKVLITNNVANK